VLEGGDLVDPVTVIAAALGAGLAKEPADPAARDAYSALRDALRHRLGGREDQLDSALTDPDAGQGQLTALLEASDSGQDETVLMAAHQVLRLTDPGGVEAGKYAVDLRNAKGVQVGDRNIQVNKF
jgi:hypothetical protein